VCKNLLNPKPLRRTKEKEVKRIKVNFLDADESRLGVDTVDVVKRIDKTAGPLDQEIKAVPYKKIIVELYKHIKESNIQIPDILGAVVASEHAYLSKLPSSPSVTSLKANKQLEG
jgi:hypothetical protein